jgi:hypothetical protein
MPVTGFATPISKAATVREARNRYLADNGFSLEMYAHKTFEVPVGPFTLSLPNPPSRQAAVAAHDLHHVLTGYGTDLRGEVEVSCWELRAGVGRSPLIWWIVGSAVLAGLLRFPRLSWRALKRARGARSLLRPDTNLDDLLPLSVACARERLGVPEDGVAERPAKLNPRAPGPDPNDAGRNVPDAGSRS